MCRRARAAAVDGLMHRRKHVRMLPHSEVIVGAPDGYVALSTGAVIRRSRKVAHMTLKIRKNTVAPFPAQAVELFTEIAFVVHCFLQSAGNVV